MLTREQIERNREFLKDLRANEHKAFGKMTDCEGGRCCLQVALDTAVRLGYDPNGVERISNKLCDTQPPETIKHFYGWKGKDPELIDETTGIKAPASKFNDGSEQSDEFPQVYVKTHKKIADLFENAFPELKQ